MKAGQSPPELSAVDDEPGSGEFHGRILIPAAAAGVTAGAEATFVVLDGAEEASGGGEEDGREDEQVENDEVVLVRLVIHNADFVVPLAGQVARHQGADHSRRPIEAGGQQDHFRYRRKGKGEDEDDGYSEQSAV